MKNYLGYEWSSFSPTSEKQNKLMIRKKIIIGDQDMIRMIDILACEVMERYKIRRLSTFLGTLCEDKKKNFS